MNILVVGGGSWDDTTSLGNTFSNFFSGWENVNIYNLYFREVRPNNSVCKNYFRITTKEILKKFLVSHKIGEAFQIVDNQIENSNKRGENETKAISLIHRYHLSLIYDVEDWLWASKKWINQKLDDFIAQVNPDIIFSFAAGNNYIVFPIEYIKAKTSAKLVLFIADDMYTTYRLQKKPHDLRLRKGLDRLFSLADRVYGISEEMCEFYQTLYNVKVDLLRKGCSFENQPKSRIGTPIKLVYAGNLLFGRIGTLKALINCLEKLKTVGIDAMIDIYSPTLLSETQQCEISRAGISSFFGGVSYSQVKRYMADADIVLHVESFEADQMNRVRYSFSTKIIDCLQSGSVMLAIGPSGISSIEYPRRIPGAVVIDELDKMYDTLVDLFFDKDGLIKKAQETRTYAVVNHDVERVRSKLCEEFRQVLDDN